MFQSFILFVSLAVAAVAAPASLVPRAGRPSPPAGCLSVGSSGTYKTVSAAVAKLSTTSTAAQCIFIYKGTDQYLSQTLIHCTDLVLQVPTKSRSTSLPSSQPLRSTERPPIPAASHQTLSPSLRARAKMTLPTMI